MRRFDIPVVLQARMASTRLPGKAMAVIGGRTLLERCVKRLSASAPFVIVATTSRPEDDVIADEALRLGAMAFRGPEHDVLKRFVLAAESVNARCLVRATADNPAVDMDAPGRVLSALLASRADYVCETGLPYGAAVEAVSLEALRRVERIASRSEDREHVTTFIKRMRTLFEVRELPAPQGVRRADLRLTVDTPEDLNYMMAVFSEAGAATEAPLHAIIGAADHLSKRALVS